MRRTRFLIVALFALLLVTWLPVLAQDVAPGDQVADAGVAPTSHEAVIAMVMRG